MRFACVSLFFVIGCSSTTSTPDAGDASQDVSAPVDAGAFESGASLTGDQAFNVAFAWMNPAQPAQECNADAVGNAYAATSIDLFETDESQAACSDAGFGSGYGRVIGIEIATDQYAGKHSLTQPLAPANEAPGGVHHVRSAQRTVGLRSAREAGAGLRL